MNIDPNPIPVDPSDSKDTIFFSTASKITLRANTDALKRKAERRRGLAHVPSEEELSSAFEIWAKQSSNLFIQRVHPSAHVDTSQGSKDGV